MTKKDLRERLHYARKTQQQLADMLGVSFTSASRLARGDRKMSADEAALIDAWLNGNSNEPASPKDKIPLYGYAAAGNGERIALVNNQIIDWVDAPPYSTVSGEIAAIRILGESMEPRLFAGEEILIARGLSPARGKDCVIEFHDGSAVVKTYERSRDGRVFARQYNPEQLIDYSADEVKKIHAVIWRR